MPRIAVNIHVIARKTELQKLRRTSRRGIWETGDWIVGDLTGRQLIGGTVYVHAGQQLPSYAGGTILEIFHRAGMDENRRVIIFRWSRDAVNIVSDESGWSYERKIDWTEPTFPELKITKGIQVDDESAFPEGRAKYKLHYARERDGRLVRKAKLLRLQETGKLACEVCKYDFAKHFGSHGMGFIEAHHTKPVSTLDGKTKTRIEDLAMVCSNCHRMLHRGKPLFSINDLRDVLEKKSIKF